MKNTIGLLICVAMVFSCFSSAVFAAEEHISIYVSNGAQNGNGSYEQPFGSFEEARDKVRQIKNDGAYPQGGITVYFREGVYFVKDTMILENADSGTDGAPVVYRAYGNEQVDFIGGLEIDIASFSAVSDANVLSRIPAEARNKVKEINLTTAFGLTDFGVMGDFGNSVELLRVKKWANNLQLNPSPELFFNDEMLPLARYPNEGYSKIDSIVDGGNRDFRETGGLPAPITIKGAGERILRWENADQARAFGYWFYDWSDMSCGVTIDAGQGTITTKLPCPYSARVDQRFYIFNLIEELDMPGEWFLDRNTGTLYIYPPSQSGKIIYTILDKPIFCLDGASNVSLKCFSLKGTRDNAIDISGGRNNTVELCTVTMASKQGIICTNSFSSQILSCHVYNTGNGGIKMENKGVDLEPCYGNVENNRIHDYSLLSKTYSAGLSIGGVGNRLAHNKVYNGPHMAISFSGNDNIIEYNEVFNVLQEADDAGAVYCGRRKDCRGNILRNNYFHDFDSDGKEREGVVAIYLDDGFDGVTIDSNVFENCTASVWINGGRDNTVTNNLFINDTRYDVSLNTIVAGRTMESFAESYKPIVEQQIHKTKPYEKYPHLANLMEDDPTYPKYNVIKNNVSVVAPDNVREVKLGSEKGALTHKLLLEINEVEAPYALTDMSAFVNAETKDYTILKNSKVYEMCPEYVAPDFKNMGMYTYWLKQKLDGSVSVKVDSPIAYIGFNDTYIDEDNTNVTPRIINDSTYVPIRFIAEALGGKAEYNAETDTASVVLGKDTLTMELSTGKMYLNNTLIETDKKPVVTEGRTLVPIRIISEELSYRVDWYESGLVLISERGDLLKSEIDAALLKELDRRLSNR